jgi:YD repeat-containing protein
MRCRRSGCHQPRWLGELAAAAQDSAQAQYTANGQPSRIGAREYVSDALGQLTAVRQEDKSLASYTYSHRGERIGKTVQGHTTQYLYNDAGQISAELNANGRITRQYLYLADQPIAVIDTADGEALSNQELLAQEPRGLEAKNILKTLMVNWRNPGYL